MVKEPMSGDPPVLIRVIRSALDCANSGLQTPSFVALLGSGHNGAFFSIRYCASCMKVPAAKLVQSFTA